MHLAVSTHADRGHGHSLEGGHGLLGPVLLGETDDGIEYHDGDDDDRVNFLAQGQRYDGGDDEDDHHQFRKLVE